MLLFHSRRCENSFSILDSCNERPERPEYHFKKLFKILIFNSVGALRGTLRGPRGFSGGLRGSLGALGGSLGLFGVPGGLRGVPGALRGVPWCLRGVPGALGGFLWP